MASLFSTGNDCKLVFMGAFGRIDFAHVTGFMAKPITKKISVVRLGQTPLMEYQPGGYEFTFSIEWASVNAEALQALKDITFWTGGTVPLETMYQYIKELDGSTSTFQFTDVASNLADPGKWEQESSVKQSYEGFASQKLTV
jgi:hypothetical protein